MNREDALRSIAAVDEFMEQTRVLWNHNERQPITDSQAAKELAEFSRPESIGTAYSQGTVLIEVAADYVMAFTRTLIEPAHTIAPWACVRGALETSALAMWILDIKIDAYERVKRSLAFRYEGLEQQAKFALATKSVISPQQITPRIDQIEQVALRLGLTRVIDRKGNRIGVGQKMPSTTQLVAEMLNKEEIYRLLSAMVHAHPWALQHFGFIQTHQNQMIFNNVKGAYFEKHISPDSIGFLCVESVTNLFQSLLMNFKLFGWDARPLELEINRAVSQMKA